ncbi:MAG: ABC transporter substrate-binding protein [Actinomycetota bacterium]
MSLLRARAGRWWKPAALGLAIVAAGVVGAVPNVRKVTISVAGENPSSGGITRTDSGSRTGGRAPNAGGGPITAQQRAACAAGRNGGATDVGVTGRTIKLGATVVETGIGKSFLADVRHSMIAVVNRVNAAGGICGRRLQLILKDDGWDANRGFGFIQNLVEQERVFALAVVPSSEGLRAASRWLRDRGVPVVGTDGMLAHQYTSPLIWPVAAATVTAMHVMVKNAYDRGARRFGIVYDSNYHFGVEGSYAFNGAVRRLTGSDVPGYVDPLSGVPQCRQGSRFCGVKAGQASYGTEVEVMNSACGTGTRCDFIVYLLEPQTAQQWMQDGGLTADPEQVRFGIAGSQPLFNRGFGSQCGRKCHDMWVWSGYTPPIEPYVGQPAVSAYVNDVRETNAQADVNNSFVLGGYLGMKLLVAALHETGPNLTRRSLAQALDRARLDTGLSTPLAWSPGRHFANQCLVAFSIQARPFFAGWRKQTDFLCDPWPGQDVPGRLE